MIARRSCLSVPGSSEKMLAKARTLPSDEVVIDLEDSVVPAVKVQARAAVTASVDRGGWGERAVAVRINGPATRWCHRDVIDVIAGGGEGLGSLVVPKVQSPGEVEFVDRLAGMVEQEIGRAAPIGLQALIETATGLREIHAIAHASPRLQALIVGYADLSASLGLPPGDGPRGGQSPAEPAYPGDRWHHVLETVVIAARDAGLQAIDGPYLAIGDLEGFRAAAQRARTLGYDGKWALHPTQIEVLNGVFAPSAQELAGARAVLDALAEAEQGNRRGALMLDGSMIDEASRKLAEQILARARAAERDERGAGREAG